jgi:alkanesulfonate monooxygenase SsuD/methylene tetrahydromethanopterin reductase-like flavin-dependent oxidoreductase (luciferase family)
VWALSATSAAQWADRARQIENLGYATLLVNDHLAGGSFGPFSAMTAAAAATTTRRVGCTAFSNDYRHLARGSNEAG